MEKKTFGYFFTDAKEHASAWFESRVDLYKLKAIRLASKVAGNLVWLIISLFLFFFLLLFIEITIGFWLSSYFGSYTAGFGTVALLILVKIGLLTIYKRQLFINPIIKKMIRESWDEFKADKEIKS